MLEATISEKSPRYKEWLAVFGTDKVRITGWTRAKVQGIEKEIYRLDIASLNNEHRERLAEHLAHKFNHPLKEMRESIKHDGVPILVMFKVTKRAILRQIHKNTCTEISRTKTSEFVVYYPFEGRRLR